jgi:hypothetical protein
MYKKFPTLDKNWTPIEQKIVEIQIGSNPIHTITRIQFVAQLVVGHIICCAQSLTFDCLAFDPSSVTKYSFTYTSLSCMCSKEQLYLFSPLSNKNPCRFHC